MLWLRALLIYPIVVLFKSLMGRGLRFQSRPYDIALEVLLGSAAANVLIEPGLQLSDGLWALAVLATLHILFSFLSLWNPAKRWLVGHPTLVIQKGQILQASLIKHRITVDELLSALREQGYQNPADVEYALLEAGGGISIVPRTSARPVTPKDLGLQPPADGLSQLLIADGHLHQEALQRLGHDETWLRSRLNEKGASSASDVLLASLDSSGQLFVVRKQDVSFLRALLQTAPASPTAEAQSPGAAPPH
ncbi:MAG: DUF421 domain-containing protein [Mycobacterium leprae]